MARGDQVQDGRRRHLDAVHRADGVLDAALHSRLVGQHQGSRQGVHDRLPRARDADARRLLGTRPRPLLSLLRGRPHPDVPHHRRLGRPAARLRELQVLPLHVPRLGPHAARHDGHVLAGGNDRHPDPHEREVSARDAVVAVARLLRLLCREAPDVARAHLAAGRPCRGADRGLGRARGRSPEDGRLWVPALLAADASRCERHLRARSCSRCPSSPSSTRRS